MTGLDSTQRGVRNGMAAAVAITILAFVAARWLRWPGTDGADGADAALGRLRLAAAASLAPASVLFVCIARLAKRRFTTPQDIQGSALSEGTQQAKLLQSLLQNSLEQAVLAIPVYFAAALLLSLRLLPLIAAAAALFTVGRVLFFRGYANGAAARALGFGLTFYPSVALLLLDAASAVSQQQL